MRYMCRTNPKVTAAIHASAAALLELMKNNIRARDIMTRKVVHDVILCPPFLTPHCCSKQAFENAIVVMMALGGSTNGVLHLLALAQEAQVELSIDDFNTVGGSVPLIGNLSPSGKVRLVHFVFVSSVTSC